MCGICGFNWTSGISEQEAILRSILGRHILAETEEKSATSDLIRETHSGDVVQPGDIAHMARCLAKVFDAYQTGMPVDDRERLAQRQAYTWATLGNQYVAILDRLCQEVSR